MSNAVYKGPFKKGDKIIVVEGADQGSKGIVTQVKREYDADDHITRWMVWMEPLDGDSDGADIRIKTRLSWVREL